ncbi:hypothetical protein Taro_043184 [Colocasia esculenta]|uniref:Neprosin PEP catalytic domain-containing protein n=1 Tax=Colocasia esculenta TaxID=4460 RepID=A0A843WIS0_COLES|nr:hypothetical protein [Colocasia esculenta]
MGSKTNGYQTYCYNLDCPGFVQTNRLVGLSSFIVPVSSVGGPQYTVDLEIFQDLSTKHWWVRLQGTDMGYWPKQLVPSFQSAGADGFDFGGRVLNTRPNGHHTSTGMGLGRFPTEGLGKAAFFRNVEIAYADYERGKYNFPGQAHPASDVPGCYFVQEGGDFHGPWVYHFYYGGPGRGNSCS